MEVKSSSVLYDPLYGYIKLTKVEREILASPFYQRLRFIKQLGFSYYLFPGAEHSRFGHSVGVMHNAHLILKSCKRAVSDQQLFDKNFNSPEKEYHQAVRLGALMHDLGTFCYSHTTEMAYISYGETTNDKKNSKALQDDHENLGSFIIKNTDYDQGITKILKNNNVNVQRISDLVKGVDTSILANQILHSEIDCDRMDYLLRDAYYTGLKYGSYDRDYLLYHFRAANISGHDVLTIKHNAIRCIEDFLMARFAWYSQVIRSSSGAKYDAVAEKITFYLLNNGMIFKYSDLLDMISTDAMKFYGFNDNYFMNKLHSYFIDGDLDKDPQIKDMAKCLLLGTGVRTIRCAELQEKLLNQNEPDKNKKIFKKAKDKVEEISNYLKKHGKKSDWIISDIPTKEIRFIKSKSRIIKSKENENILLERDPVRIIFENGDIKLLNDIEGSVLNNLQNVKNFIPNAYCSNSAFHLLISAGIIDDIKIPL